MAITTLAAIKAWLNVTTGTDDALLTALQSSAENAVLQYLGRDTLDSHSFTAKVDGNGHDTITLHDYPITAVSSLTVNGIVLDPTTYEVYGTNADNQRKIFLLANSTSWNGGLATYQLFPKGRRNVWVAGTAGYADVNGAPAKPAAVVQAVNDTVGMMYRGRTRIGERSKALAGETTTFVTALLSDAAKGLLAPYRNLIPA